jgi:Zn-dependent peptidase ImmA (M78 family)/transcriptional regulator with XRE-family HTH domain
MWGPKATTAQQKRGNNVDKIVNPDMLILARESRGMSQEDLAQVIGVSQGRISKYENGMSLVTDDDLQSLARALNYTPEFFFQKDKVYGLGSSFLFHRQRKEVPMVIQKRIQAEINILRMQVERLLRGVEIDTENSFPRLDVDDHDCDVEKIARTVRATWRLPLGPVASVTASIESACGIVLKCSFDTPLIDAAHLWLPGLPPLFFVNRDAPGDRLRWTLAHEIGHAIMHANPTGNVEEQANRFAAEFLLPEADISRFLDSNLTLEQAANLKMVWKVSMAAIIKRANDLGKINQKKYYRLFQSLSAQGMRIIEPFPIPVEEPKTIRGVVATHRKELGYDGFELAKLLFMPDPQFFAPQENPTILRIDDQPFFGFFPDGPPARRKPGRMSM